MVTLFSQKNYPEVIIVKSALMLMEFFHIPYMGINNFYCSSILMRFFNEFVRKIPIRKMQSYVTIMVFDIKGGISEFKLNFFFIQF